MKAQNSMFINLIQPGVSLKILVLLDVDNKVNNPDKDR